MAMRETSDFTLEGYTALLEETTQRYPVVGFEILADPDLAERRFCLIRHDIDMSPARALEVAKIEAAMGVRATYMVLLTGPFYSPFEPGSRDIIAEIAALGHDIGLHFDAAWHNIGAESSLNERVAAEAATLRWLLDGPVVRTFSFHNTTDFTMTCRSSSYAGLWNAYAGVLQEQVNYVSDSNGYWRFGSWRDALRPDPDRLQVLTHPEWWAPPHATPAEKICRGIVDRARHTWSDYTDLLQGAGRENRGSLLADGFMSESGATPTIQDLIMWRLSGQTEAALLELVRRVNVANSDTDAASNLTRLAQGILCGRAVDDEALTAAFDEGMKLLFPPSPGGSRGAPQGGGMAP